MPDNIFVKQTAAQQRKVNPSKTYYPDNLIWSSLCHRFYFFCLCCLILSCYLCTSVAEPPDCSAQSSNLRWLLPIPSHLSLQTDSCDGAVRWYKMGMLYWWQQGRADSTLAEPQLPQFSLWQGPGPTVTCHFYNSSNIFDEFGTMSSVNHTQLCSTAVQGRKS